MRLGAAQGHIRQAAAAAGFGRTLWLLGREEARFSGENQSRGWTRIAGSMGELMRAQG